MYWTLVAGRCIAICMNLQHLATVKGRADSELRMLHTTLSQNIELTVKHFRSSQSYAFPASKAYSNLERDRKGLRQL